jgi:hypothetical protein
MDKITLVKWMIIYSFICTTDEPTKIVTTIRRKLKNRLSHLYTYKEVEYVEAKEHREIVYQEAWEKAYGNYTRKVEISLGTLIMGLYHSIDDSSKPLVGKKQMEKLIDSYLCAKDTKGNMLEVEKESNRLLDILLKMLDDKPDISPFKRRLTILKQNRIIEQGYK